MVLGNTTLENEFAKIHNKGSNKTLAFIRKFLSKYPISMWNEFENMVTKENIENMETTDIYKTVMDEYNKIYVANSTKTLKFIANSMESLPEHVLGQIFEIVKKHNESYTSKKMETLVNLGSLKEETVQEIVKFILFIKSSMQQLNQVSNKLKDIKDSFSSIDAIPEPTIPEDPNYKPILYDYTDGPAPVIDKKHV